MRTLFKRNMESNELDKVEEKNKNAEIRAMCEQLLFLKANSYAIISIKNYRRNQIEKGPRL